MPRLATADTPVSHSQVYALTAEAKQLAKRAETAKRSYLRCEREGLEWLAASYHRKAEELETRLNLILARLENSGHPLPPEALP